MAAVRRAVLASLFVLASAGSAAAETTCRFEVAGTTRRLLEDCITDTSIEIPDGMTLDGAHHAIVALDPVGGTFRGAVVVANGRTAAIVNTSISARMLTDSWYLERRIYLVVGINLIVASTLSVLHSPWWLLFTGFVGGAMVWFAATGFCIMANGLYWLGAEPRLAPGAARRPAELAPGAGAGARG